MEERSAFGRDKLTGQLTGATAGLQHPREGLVHRSAETGGGGDNRGGGGGGRIIRLIFLLLNSSVDDASARLSTSIFLC